MNETLPRAGPDQLVRARQLLDQYERAIQDDDPGRGKDLAYELVGVACELHTGAWEHKRRKEGKR